MKSLTVTFAKLQKYCAANGGYDLEVRKGKVTLTFVPNFPEAQDKGGADQQPPRVIMSGPRKGGKVTFQKVILEDQEGIREKSMADAKLTYESWLQFIEDNY